MIQRNYPTVFINCTAMYLILSTKINFWQIWNVTELAFFNEHVQRRI